MFIYYDVYLATNVLLFYCSYCCLKPYKLGPAYFYTALGLARQALKKTAFEHGEHEAKNKDNRLCLVKFRVQPFRGTDMLQMFEKGV